MKALLASTFLLLSAMWPQTTASAQERARESAQLPPPIFEPHETVLFQGDSITDGNRGRTLDPNHILGHGYAFSIASLYGASYPDLDLTFVNRGVSGNRVEDLVARWSTDTLAIKPDVLSILVGINDVFGAIQENRPLDLGRLEAQYDSLLSLTKRANPHAKLILCEPFVLDVGMVAKNPGQWRKLVGQVSEVVERLGAKYHVPVVHFQRVFDEAVKRAPASHWIWDGIHPTYSGHHLLTEEWIRAYNDFYVSPIRDPERNSALMPAVNFERDSYDWLHRHADVLDEQRKGPEIVLIGDSITHFWGGEPRDKRSNGPKSWDATFNYFRVLNMGFGWDRTQNVLWRLGHGEFVHLRPLAVVLNIGTNNLVGDETARTNTPAETAAGIEAIVNVVHERSPYTNIIVMAVFPRGFEKGNELDARITELNKILRSTFRSHPEVRMIDIGDRLRSSDGSISREILFDGTHPTEKGYAIWGEALHDAGVGSRRF